jgi:hypothetical protein
VCLSVTIAAKRWKKIGLDVQSADGNSLKHLQVVLVNQNNVPIVGRRVSRFVNVECVKRDGTVHGVIHKGKEMCEVNMNLSWRISTETKSH